MFRKNRMQQLIKSQQALTLIELLIVLMIISALVALTYPSYTRYVMQGHRAQAKSDLIKLQLALEESYDISNSATSHGYDLNLVNNCLICDTSSDRYTFSATSEATYTLRATPVSEQGQDKDHCGVLMVKANSETYPIECW